MKKLIFGFVATVLFSFIGNAQTLSNNFEASNLDNLYASNELPIANYNSLFNNENIVGRKWWATCIVDAAGALGGAASVASFINVGSATPWGWAAIGGGAILGGAGASLARVGNVRPIDNGIKNLSNSLNELDYVGIKHNQIINDYFANYSEYNTKNYFEFINKNKSKYGIEKIYFDEKYLDVQSALVKSLDTDVKIVDYALSNLPSEINKEDFKRFLNSLNSIESGDKFIAEIKNYENKLMSGKISNDTKLKLSSFFSTMRYSSNLW